MGRQFTQQFGYTSETFFLRNHTPSELSYAYLFTYYCIFFFYLGTIIRLPQKNNVPQIDDFTIRKINKLFFKILLICIAPMLWYYFKLITVAQIAAYGSREFDAMTADTGYLVSYMRVFGVISTIGLICISYMSGKKSIILHLFYFFVIGLSLLSGSRTEGMGLLLLLIMLYTNRNQTSGKAMIIATLLLLLLSTLIPFFFNLRRDITQIDVLKPSDFINFDGVLQAIHEMGGSESPLLIVMDETKDFQYGKSLVLAFLNTIFNFLPHAYRPDFSWIGNVSLADSYSRMLGLDFGLGFSLTAEAYANFGWLGCFLFMGLGALFGMILNRKMSTTVYISNLIFVFFMFTIARRESKDMLTMMVYYWLPFEIVLSRIGKKYEHKDKCNYVSV